ncbi:hypothetical protein V6N13_024843 [Hibiscus sabdariffa]
MPHLQQYTSPVITLVHMCYALSPLRPTSTALQVETPAIIHPSATNDPKQPLSICNMVNIMRNMSKHQLPILPNPIKDQLDQIIVNPGIR